MTETRKRPFPGIITEGTSVRTGDLLDSLPDAIVLYDLEGRVLYFNSAFEQLYGWELEACQGKTIDFVPEEEKERTQEAISLALKGEKVYIETRRIRRDGETLNVEIKTASYLTTNGQVRGIFVIHRNLAEKISIANALVESESRYRLLLDASPDPIAVYDRDGKITYLNPAFESAFGWKLAELSGKGIDFVPESEREKTMDGVRRIIRGEPVTLETKRYTKEGELLDIHLKTGSFFDSEGKVAGNVIIYRDMTNSKKIERELLGYRERLEELVATRTRELILANARLAEEVAEHERTEKALKDNEERFRSLADLLPKIVYETDVRGTLTYTNRRGFEATGYTPDQLSAGINISSLFVPDDRERLDENVKMLFDGYQTKGNEYRMIRADGSALTVLAFSSPIKDGSRIIGLRGILADITHQKEIERQLAQSSKMEAVGTLAGGIAHDFNNILQIIASYSDIMSREFDDNLAIQKYVVHISAAVERASHLVKNLLLFCRKSESNFKLVDLNEVIRSIQMIISHTFPKMIRIESELARDLNLVSGDASQIEQMILNLANNARDAMADGGSITLSTVNLTPDESFFAANPECPRGGYVVLTVTDTGTGMEERVRNHVFEPFFTTKEVGKGTGLGLAMVYGSMLNHKGTILCESEPGKGTSFRLYFPAAAMVLSKETAALDSAGLVVGRGETVLIADDEPYIRDAASTYLTDRHFNVIAVSSGEEALERYEPLMDEIAVVILDLGMPGMGGILCLEKLKILNPRVKVIVASGYQAHAQAKGVSDLGIEAFLNKPYRLSELARTVRSAIDS